MKQYDRKTDEGFPVKLIQMSGPMGKTPLWKNCKFSDERRILSWTAEKCNISLIMPRKIKIQHVSNCIPFSKYCNIAILANVITEQANNTTVSKMS